jgi:hypothetical protein
MPVDLSVDLIKATVQLEQPLGDGSRTVGTGFLIADTAPDGQPRTILITAAHVFEKMPSMTARIGYRVQGSDRVWRYDPESLKIREGDHPLWVKHPTRDIAAMVVAAPEEFVRAAIPLTYLAKDDTFNAFNLGPGDEMMALGFPRGLSANPAGFPILRSGRVASYPLTPSTDFPTFLLDFSVFPGNSGGPVFMAQAARRRPGASDSQDVQFIAGLLTQQVELSGERLEIGIVTHAKFIRETLALIDQMPGAPVSQARASPPPPPGAIVAVSTPTAAVGANR